MPRFEPFAGIRYAPSVDLDAVTAPPYDVMSRAERDGYAAKHTANAVRYDAPTGDDPYGEAARLLERLRADGTLVVDLPSLYLYRMTNGGRHTTGVIGALGLEPPGAGDVLPHEHTTKKAKSDRLDLLRATRANLSPIWGLSLAKGLADLTVPPEPSPDGCATDPDGIVHELWRVTDADHVAAIVERVESAPVVIADGHHRYETCLAYQAERGPAPGGHDLTMMFVVELTEDELDVQPIHRLLRGLPAEQIADHLARSLDPGEGITLVGPHRSWTFAPRPGGPKLDTEQLAAALGGLAGVELAYQHGDVAALVRAGDADAAVVLRPVTVATIQAVADRRDRMPPKTTYFFPKPRTGFVLRALD